MDVPRTGAKKRRTTRLVFVAGVLALTAAGAAWGVSRLQPALPLVEGESVWSDAVKRGPMLREIHGIGSLVPQEVTWISAQVDGRIEKIHLLPGTPVQADTVIMELS